MAHTIAVFAEYPPEGCCFSSRTEDITISITTRGRQQSTPSEPPIVAESALPPLFAVHCRACRAHAFRISALDCGMIELSSQPSCATCWGDRPCQKKPPSLVGDQKIELPILVGTEGERAVDITRLRDQTGLITYDPSLGNTGVCKSAITFIDGEKGILRYRGIPIEQFTKKPNFVEVAWLLIFGRLPRKEELDQFSRG